MTQVKEKEKLSIPLRAVVYPSGKWCIAHCLELDIVAEGATSKDALDNLVDLIDFQIEKALEVGDIGSIFRPAPAEIWKIFWVSTDRPVGRRLPAPPIKSFEARELALA